MSSLRRIRETTSLSTFNTSANRFMTFWTEPMLSTSNDMINIRCHTTSKWATKCGCICKSSTSLDPTVSFICFDMGPYTLTKAVGENVFELRIPPFLGLHPVFNVDHLRPYFPHVLDTSDMAEQLTPTELNLDCMEQSRTNQIMDTQIKHTRKQRIPLYQVVKAGQLLHQGKWLTRDQV
jgi:hypothetical protein